MADSQKSKKQKQLEQDNFVLKSKILAMGGQLGTETELPAETENEFFRQIIAIENAPLKPTYEILEINLKDFPPVDQLSEEQLQQKFNALMDILDNHSFYYDLREGLPIEIAYKYLTEDFLLQETEIMPEGWVTHIDGCGGWCPSCFQLDYCDIWQETWTKEEIEKERKEK